MANETDPIVGNWYYHLDKGQRFYVVAVDEEADIVEIQHFDGDLEEVAMSDWSAINIAIGEPPANWSGATDIGELDDYGTEITDTTSSDWNDPLREFTTTTKV